MKLDAPILATIATLALSLPGSTHAHPHPHTEDSHPRSLHIPLRRRAQSAHRTAYVHARDADQTGIVNWPELQRIALRLETRYAGADHPDVVQRRQLAQEKRWVLFDQPPELDLDFLKFEDGEDEEQDEEQDQPQEHTLPASPSPAIRNDRLAKGSSGKNSKHPSSSGKTGGNEKASVQMQDIVHGGQDTEYLAETYIGSPPVKFLLDLDSGSSDVWVTNKQCKSTSCGTTRTRYDPKKSHTYRPTPHKKSFHVQYGIGSVSGHLVRDLITLGGLAVNNQTLGSANQLSSDWAAEKADGILGLGFREIASANQKPFFQNLVAQNSLSSPVLSFAFGRSSSGTAGKSELLIGSINDNLHKGDLSYVPLSKRGYWQFAIKSIHVDGKKAVSGPDGIVDTGTSLIAMPAEQADQFWSSVKGAKRSSQPGGFWSFPCTHKLNARVHVAGGKTIEIRDEDLNLGRESKGSQMCVGGILAAQTKGAVVLGVAFLKNAYTVLDHGSERIGFATPRL